MVTGTRCTRRSALRTGVAAAGVAVTGSMLSACGPTVADLTAAAASPIVLTWQPWTGFAGGGTPTAAGLMLDGLRPWLADHPGVQVRVASRVSTGATLAAMRAGRGPDVFHGVVLPPYRERNLALDLQPFVRSSGIDMSMFSQSAIAYYTSAEGSAGTAGALYCLPAFMNTLAMAVNVGKLYELGLNPPEPGWDDAQWTAFWQAATHPAPGTAHRYGGNLRWSGYDASGGGNPAPFYLKGFGGEYVDPANTARCYLDHPGSVGCLQWSYDLRRAGVLGGNNRADIGSGRQISGPLGTGGDLVYAAQNWRGDVRWDIVPLPVWPNGAATYGSSDFYAIWEGTPVPEIAWSLLRFLSAESEWQTFMTKLALVGPSLKALWPQWEATVLQYAAPLSRVRLDVFTQAVQQDLPYVGLSFRFADTQSAQVIKRYCLLAQAGAISVPAAAQRASAEVDALQAGSGSAEQRSAKALQQVERAAAAMAVKEQPPLAGSGNAPLPVGNWLKAGSTSGAFLLLGDGSAIGDMADSCVFAGSAQSAMTAEYSCRVTQLVNLTCPTLSPTATAGLMVRGNLGDGAAMLALAVTVGSGVVLEVRPVGTGTSVTLPAAVSVLGVGAGETVPAAVGRPIWLKLRRSGTTWTAFVSVDGRVWRPAGSPLTVAVSAVWAGLYVCAGNGGFGGKGYVRAGFDAAVGFVPSAAYQLGRSGIPPAAGPVPPDWRTMTPA